MRFLPAILTIIWSKQNANTNQLHRYRK